MANLLTLGMLSTTGSGRDGLAHDMLLGALDLDPVSSGIGGTGVVSTSATLGGITIAVGQGISGTADSSFRSHDLALPALTVDGVDFAAVLPALTATGEGRGDGTTAQANADLPALVATAQGVAGTLGSATVTLPALDAYGVDAVSQITLPPLAVTASGQAGTRGASSLLGLPALDLTASGHASTMGDAAIALPAIVAVGSGHAAVQVSLQTALPALSISGEGLAGTSGRATLVIPTVQTRGSGGLVVTGTASISLPAFEITAVAPVANPVPAGGVDPHFAVALNTSTRAAAEYRNVPFNSLASFQGVLLAAGAGGLFALDAADDDGEAIAARIGSATTDFGTDLLKRVRHAYLGLRTGAPMELILTTEDGAKQVYPVYPAQFDQLMTTRVKFCRGVDSRYWQWELANVDGGDFSLADLTLYPEVLSRRIK